MTSFGYLHVISLSLPTAYLLKKTGDGDAPTSKINNVIIVPSIVSHYPKTSSSSSSPDNFKSRIKLCDSSLNRYRIFQKILEYGRISFFEGEKRGSVILSV